MKNLVHSLNEHRLSSNPLEKRFLELWHEQNKFSGTLEWILSGGPVNERMTVSLRDAQVAATMMQWLGSPIGMAFLEETLGIPDLRKQVQKRFSGP